MQNCILCESEKIRVYQIVKFELLRKIYRDSLDIDISNEVNEESEVKVYRCENCTLDFFDPKFAGGSSFYEELQIKRKVYYSPDRREFSFASQFIKEYESVLEIGSGSGFFAQKIPKNNYVGLEFNNEAIRRASENGITLIKESIENYAKLNKDKFDVVCSFHVLEHVQNPADFLKASISKLNSNGKLIIVVPCNDSVFTSDHNHVLNLPPHHITRWKISCLNNMEYLFDLKLIDFKIISISETINKKNYVKAVFLKKILNILYPRNKIVIDTVRLKRIKRFTDFIVLKLRLYKMYRQSDLIGENVMFVFEKKN